MWRFCFLLLLFLVTPAWAQGWTHYANALFGYETDIPPFYVGQGQTADGDGETFFLPDGLQSLTMQGGVLREASHSLQAEAMERVERDVRNGLSLSSQSSAPDWASWSGTLGSRVIHQRMILLCDRKSYATFRIEYEMGDLNAMRPIIDGLVNSFRASGC